MPKAKRKSKTTSNRPAQRRLRVQRVVSQRIELENKLKAAWVKKCADQVPTTWLDDLLTGPNKVLHGNGGTWGCPEIEKLCRAIKARILKLANIPS
jgi:hypothetical protein